jgi:RNase P subunit RPR2
VIKVIRKRHKSKVRRTVCGKCAAELEYTLADTTEECRKDYSGSSDNYTVLVCPECKNRMDV